MNLKAHIKLLKQNANNTADHTPGCQPPEKSLFQKPDGFYDMEAYRAAVDAWGVEIFWKSLYEVAEQIAECEGF